MNFLDADGSFWFRCSAIVDNALNTLWSESSFLSALTDKYWDFSTKMLKNYLEWLSNVYRWLIFSV